MKIISCSSKLHMYIEKDLDEKLIKGEKYMQIHATTLHNKSKLINQYQSHDEEVMNYFDYKPYESLNNRLVDIKSRNYNRKALRDALYTMNQTWNAPRKTFENIDQLLNEESVVV